jgi:putative endonuclease
MWTFYILYSKKLDKFYIGFTGDPIKDRIRKHNSNHKGFTGGVGDWRLKYLEHYQEKNIASAREKQIKGWKSRKMIEKIIGSEHPD